MPGCHPYCMKHVRFTFFGRAFGKAGPIAVGGWKFRVGWLSRGQGEETAHNWPLSTGDRRQDEGDRPAGQYRWGHDRVMRRQIEVESWNVCMISVLKLSHYWCVSYHWHWLLECWGSSIFLYCVHTIPRRKMYEIYLWFESDHKIVVVLLYTYVCTYVHTKAGHCTLSKGQWVELSSSSTTTTVWAHVYQPLVNW